MQIQSFQRCPMLILLFRQRYSIVDPMRWHKLYVPAFPSSLWLLVCLRLLLVMV